MQGTREVTPGSDVEVWVHSWAEFLECIGGQRALPKEPLRRIFRGQANAEHPLSPSLLRAVRVTEKEPGYGTVRDFEQKCFREFEAEAHLMLPPSLFRALPTEIHWWPHMQHFGAPTRLLDWTISPYVAAYFACESNPESDGAVWALEFDLSDFSMPSFLNAPNSPDYEERLKTFLDGEPGNKLCLHNQGQRNERMAAQRGVFMFSQDASARHDKILCDLAKGNEGKDKFRKLRIPSGQKREFYRHLHAMNISARSLFPGIDGLGRSLTERARYNDFQPFKWIAAPERPSPPDAVPSPSTLDESAYPGVNQVHLALEDALRMTDPAVPPALEREPRYR